MSDKLRAYVKHLEEEVQSLKEQLALDERVSATPCAFNILVFDLQPTADSDTFVWRCALPIGGVSVAVSRSDVARLCEELIKAQHEILLKLDS